VAKRAPRVELALHPEPTAQHCYESRRDGQSQTRPAKAPGGGTVCLVECLKDRFRSRDRLAACPPRAAILRHGNAAGTAGLLKRLLPFGSVQGGRAMFVATPTYPERCDEPPAGHGAINSDSLSGRSRTMADTSSPRCTRAGRRVRAQSRGRARTRVERQLWQWKPKCLGSDGAQGTRCHVRGRCR